MSSLDRFEIGQDREHCRSAFFAARETGAHTSALQNSALAAWARKWGDKIVNELIDPEVDETALAVRLEEVEDELTDAEKARDDQFDAITKAIKLLENEPPDVEGALKILDAT